MKKTIPAVKGTVDFYPELMGVRTWLYNKIRIVSEAYGYQEYEAPILETYELYAAKSGEEIVNKQSFVFSDRSGDQITLRPELTPSLARMVAQRQQALTYPVRWWSYGPMWRYENPQKGRTREFFQWNIDLIGMDTPEADAELATIGAEFLQSVGLTPDKAKIRVNSRRLMESELNNLGISGSQLESTIQLIDKQEKMAPPAWMARGKEISLSDSQMSGIQAILKNDQLWEKSDELKAFFNATEVMGSSGYFEFSAGTIRGLNYYTGIIFECFDIQGSYRSIFAGGRYDNLVEDVGGSPLPGVGFAMGDKVIQVVLEDHNLLPDSTEFQGIDILVTTFSLETINDSLKLARFLRRAGFNVVSYPGESKLGKQMKFGSKIGAKVALIIGPDEVANGMVTVRDMDTRDQETIPADAVINTIHQILDQRYPS
jgi:histidyl-tRNA synthetase